MTESGTPERVLHSEEIYNGRILRFRVNTVELATGRRTKREIVEHPGAVAVVALDDAGQVVLVRQYRAAVERFLLEIPAGTLEAGEDPGRCAPRELAEETGLTAARWSPVVRFYSAPGFCTELLHVYLAEGLTETPGQAEEDESISVERVPFARALDLIAAGEIQDAKSIAGLFAVARTKGI